MDHVENPESTGSPAEVVLRLREAERCLAAGTTSSLASALAAIETSLRWVRDQEVSSDYSVAWVEATALLLRGNCLRELATSQSRLSALSSYDEALTVLRELDSARGVDARNLLANVWTNRGIALLIEGGSDNLTESIRSFDNAIACRRNFPPWADPWIHYGLAAGWMNRGDALTRLGGPNNLELALNAYDEALGVLLSLPLQGEPAFRERTAIAWMNRGITLQAVGTQAASSQAIQSFDQAEASLGASPATRESVRILAAACMNHANALLQSEGSHATLSCQSARRAITYSDGVERESLASAEVGVKARYILCQALARLLEAEQDNRRRDELFAQATDAVDEGMELIRHWNGSGSEKLLGMANDLFRFGSRLYQAYQPHFLTEFLLENLDPQVTPVALEASPQMHLAAIEVIGEELRRISRDGFKMVSKPEFNSLLERLRLLRIADEKLACLRNRQSKVNPPAALPVSSDATAECSSPGQVMPDPRSDR